MMGRRGEQSGWVHVEFASWLLCREKGEEGKGTASRQSLASWLGCA